MRVMIDTNIFISAALFPKGKTASALMKALMPPYEPVTSNYVIEELHRKFREKFPEKISALEDYISATLQTVEIIKTSEAKNASEELIRDEKDRPILRAALDAGAALLLTGDKDFLESVVKDPRIVSVETFLSEK